MNIQPWKGSKNDYLTVKNKFKKSILHQIDLGIPRLNSMNTFEKCLKIFLDSVQDAQWNIRRKFGADQRIFKLSAIFPIWLGKNHQSVIKGLTQS